VTTVVSFRSGGQDWAVALDRVQRVLAAMSVLPYPDPKPGVAGLLYRDGDTVPVVSPLGAAGGQVLVLDDGGTSIGLLVDEVVGIERVQGEAGPPPAGQRSPLVAGVLAGRSPLLLLDVAALTGWLDP
jgi:chemotaxis signal transduction protein